MEPGLSIIIPSVLVDLFSPRQTSTCASSHILETGEPCKSFTDHPDSSKSDRPAYGICSMLFLRTVSSSPKRFEVVLRAVSGFASLPDLERRGMPDQVSLKYVQDVLQMVGDAVRPGDQLSFLHAVTLFCSDVAFGQVASPPYSITTCNSSKTSECSCLVL